MVHAAEPKTPKTVDSQISYTGIESAYQAALEHARRLTDMYGTNTAEVAIAWETVEEIGKAKREQAPSLTASFAAYCEANPEAPECRIYED